MDTVVVDLASAQGIQNTYVMLSRAKGLRKLAVFRWFSSHHIFSRLQHDLQNELDRLMNLDAKTHNLFAKHHRCPREHDA